MRLTELPYMLFKRFQAKFFPALFFKSVIDRNYPVWNLNDIAYYKEIIFEPLSEFSDDGMHFIRDDQIIGLRKRYDVVASINNMFREFFVSECSDYLTQEVGMKPTEVRVRFKPLFEQYSAKLFPPLPPIEYFTHQDTRKDR